MVQILILSRELRATRYPGFYRRFLPDLPHLRLQLRDRRTVEILFCVHQQNEGESISERAPGTLLPDPLKKKQIK